MKYITIFFDYEGVWGMPFKVAYNLEKITIDLLKILKKHQIRAVFNTCGIIAEKYPDVIKKIYKEGHELSVHGYEHEDINKISPTDFDLILKKVNSIFIKHLGIKPVGFRAPYLLSPSFFIPEHYKILENNGYIWASNRQVRFVDELRRFGNINTSNVLIKTLYNSDLLKNKKYKESVFMLLNQSLILRDRIDEKANVSIQENINWLLNKQAPFYRKNIFEIPILSTLDCFLLGTSYPTDDSQVSDMNLAKSIIENEYNSIAGNYFNCNFHDWIIGSANRIKLFDEILSFLKNKKNNKFVTAHELTKLKYE